MKTTQGKQLNNFAINYLETALGEQDFRLGDIPIDEPSLELAIKECSENIQFETGKELWEQRRRFTVIANSVVFIV